MPDNDRESKARASIAKLLSVLLCLFLAEAGLSLLDDTLSLAFDVHALELFRGLVFVLFTLLSLLVYLLLGLMPLIPKRWVLPVLFFNPLVLLGSIPVLIYHYQHLELIFWLISFGEVLFSLGMVFGIQGAPRLRWPLFRPEQLGRGFFGGWHLFGFVAANAFVLVPGVLLYLMVCASLAVGHFTEGFLALRWNGLAARAKTYVRDDHKIIELIPMMHIGETSFYQQISETFPSNSVILMEGVTDNQNRLKNQLRYQQAASSLGLKEQQEEFVPAHGRPRDADLDTEQFSETTIKLLDEVALIYTQGWNLTNIQVLARFSNDPRILDQLVNDILFKRNAKVLQEIKAELRGPDVIVVPWGAFHMPGIVHGVEESGFHLSATREFQIVHFRSLWNHLLRRRQHPKRIAWGEDEWRGGPALPAAAPRVGVSDGVPARRVLARLRQARRPARSNSPNCASVGTITSGAGEWRAAASAVVSPVSTKTASAPVRRAMAMSV
jgi:hypothetical protein